jgi:long-chain acyl-CoA synthetase
MQVTRLFDALYYQNAKFPKSDALTAKIDGQWKKTSTHEIIEIINKLGSGVLAHGLVPGDKVGIVSYNRPEWVCVDLAMQQLGIVTVPMYPNSAEGDYKFITEDAELKMIFVGDAEVQQKIKNVVDQISIEVGIYSFDVLSGVNHWEDLMQAPVDLEKIETCKNNVKSNDMATIIYTSGTTGVPKGVMLSHRNILSNAEAVAEAFAVETPTYKVLSFLPLCHIFARTALYTYFRIGVSIYYAESIDTIGENLKEVKPDFFATVPRLLEKVYDKIVMKGYELTGVKKILFFWALKLGDQYIPHQDQGFVYNLKLKIANKIIFNKWREALGGNIKFIVSGAAALQPRLTRVFCAAQIPVLEAYGQTESSPGITFTRRGEGDIRIGCVGELLKEVEVKIADDGEILVKGPNVMLGYYKRQDLTDETIDKEGWLHTGDIGEFQEDRFLKITDRKKEMFKTSGGKYIAPQALENKFKESMLIEQIMVVGESQKFPSALIIPSFDGLREWCRLHKITYSTNQEMVKLPSVLEKFEKEMELHNATFAQYQKVKKFELLPDEWGIDSGELTPTLKLKRKVIKQKHLAQIEAFYE